MDLCLEYIKDEVRRKLCSDATGHDYFHVERVAKLAGQMAQAEEADGLVCQVAGFLHDYCRPDEKERGISHTGEEALCLIRDVLKASGLDERRREMVMECIAQHEYYPHLGGVAPRLMESRILQDADRLDAIGAIGIARAFMFAGAHGNPMYLPEAGRENAGTKSAVAHFYEKLFLLAGEMHTKAGQKTAAHYHKVMKQFLEEFYDQWECRVEH